MPESLSPRTSTLLHAYINRMLPAYLQPDAAIPQEWDGPPDDWHQLTNTVRRMAEERLTRQFVDAIASGWRPQELVRGRLDDGRTASMNGVVIDQSASPSEGKMSSQAYDELKKWESEMREFIAARQR